METEINIAEILKDKPEGTKLWTGMFGSVTLYVITDACDAFQVKHHYNKEPWFDKDGKFCKEGVLCIYPSKSMRDWSKFAWKKGDVLVSNDNTTEVIFNGWKDDTYTLFRGAYALITHNDGKVEFGSDSLIFETCNYKGIEVEDAAQCYINCIEKRLGGKLNLETLEIENQLEFKDGDIIVTDAVPSLCYSKCIFILKGDLHTSDSSANSYVLYNVQNDKIHFNVLDENIRKRNIRLATDSEKQQLFSALKKEGELKPFDDTPVKDTKWHSAKEAPNYEEWIIIEWYDKDDGGTKYETNYLYCFMHWKDYVKRDNITKWCYIKDVK